MPAARRIGALTLAAGATVFMSGCYGITGQTAAQRDVNGDVDVTTEFCQTGASNNTSVRDETGTCVLSDGDAEGAAVQLFVSYLLPDGFKDPKVGSGTGMLASVTFSKAPEEQTETITADAETPSGFHWVTYASTAVTTLSSSAGDYPTGPTTGPLTASIKATFDTEYTFRDLRLRTATSWRWLGTPSDPSDPAYAIDREVECGQAHDPVPGGLTPLTSCLYSVAPATQANPDSVGDAPPSTPDGLWTIPTTRLEVLGPQSGDEDSAPKLTAGTTGRVQFGQFGHVAPGAATDTVPLSGSTDIPGAVVSTADHLKIGSEDAINVDVAIPASTPAGEYSVLIEAGEKSGTRETGQLIRVLAAPVVPAKPAAPASPAAPAAPAPTAAQQLVTGTESFSDALESKKKTKALRKGSVKLPFTVPSGGTVRVSVLGKPKGKGKKAPVLAVGTATAKKAGVVDIKLKRTAEGKRLFAAGKPITGTIVVRFWGPDGKAVSTTVPVKLD